MNLGYHDFRWLGLPTPHRNAKFAANQAAKASVIGGYTLLAMAKCRNRGDAEVTYAELFCADGYYAMLARHFGADRTAGFDSDRDGYLAGALAMRDQLKLTNVDFYKAEIMAIPEEMTYSIVANVGGLYHCSDPRAVLERSYRMATRYLIVQNSVSLATDSEDYFESPAPGWTWGSRLSRQSFDKMIRDLGYKVIDHEFNELTGNQRLEDRGSAYYLIEK